MSDPATKTDASTHPALGPIRENLSAFAIAIAVTVLFKYFAIEAYQIPTSSMQPTLMGSSEAQVFDRLLVDKRVYELHEPRRWDVAVFRYPIRLMQNYVKRIVGVGGDRLRIGSGNLYRVKDGTDGIQPEDREVLRKPDLVQEQLWREIFPAGLDLYGGSSLDPFFRPSPRRAWEEVDGERDAVRLTEKARVARLTYGSGPHKIVNAVYDGYPTATARAIKESYGGAKTAPGELRYVRDVRFDAAIQPDDTLEELRIELAAREIGGRQVVYALRIGDGKGRLSVDVSDKEAIGSEPFDATIAAGRKTRVRFEHRDDRMRVWIDGVEKGSLDTVAVSTLTSFEVGENTSLVLQLELHGASPTTVTGLRLDRDLHYLKRGRVDLIEVPEGHFFMMGDNTQQSVDGREWSEIEVAVGPDGEAFDPRTAPAEYPRLRGNFRPRQVGSPVDADENPVPVVMKDRIAFTDHVGEVHVLKGRPAFGASDTSGGAHTIGSPTDGRTWSGVDGVWIEGPDGTAWQAPETKNAFVRRQDVLGRALVIFWPWYRVGVIR